MRINSIGTVSLNNYQNSNCRKNEVNFRGFLSGTMYEYTGYFNNKANLGYEKEKYDRASDAILYQYSPLARFSWSAYGIYIYDQIEENPKKCLNYSEKASYYSLDDILEKREEIELNLINAEQQMFTCVSKSEVLDEIDKLNIFYQCQRTLKAAQEFFNTNPQLYTDKLKQLFEGTVKNCETVIKDLTKKAYPGLTHLC